MNLKITTKLLIASLALAFVGCDQVQESVNLEQPRVYIEDVESPLATTVTATLAPNESSSAFFYAIGKASDRELFLDQMLEGIQYSSQSEPLEVTFEGLKGNTEYTIFACAQDADGEYGSLSSFIVKSYDVEFKVDNVYVGAENTAFTISTNSAVYRVDYYFGEQGQAEAFAADELSGVEFITEQTYKCCNYYDLEQDKDYSFYAKAYDRRGGVSEVVEMPITTKTSDTVPAVEFTVGENDIYLSSFKMEPNDLCSKYYLLPGEAGSYSTIFDNANGYAGNVYDMMLAWAGEDWGVYTNEGISSFKMENFALTSSVSYEFYILSCDLEGNPASLQRFLVDTEPQQAEGKAEVAIEPLEITSSSASFTITPNEHTVGVLFQTFTKTTYENYWSTVPEELYAYQLSQWIAAVYNGNPDIPWKYGSEPFTYSEPKISTGKYYVVATPVNAAGVDNDGWGDITVYEFEVK